MTFSIELLVVALCGIGTFLMRLLPIWRARRQSRAAVHDMPADTRLQRFFTGIGPAAITALLVVSMLPFFTTGASPRLLAASAALAVIYLSKRLTRGLAGPTLLGAASYGLLMHWLTPA